MKKNILCMVSSLVLMSLVGIAGVGCSRSHNEPQLSDKNVEQVIDALTLDEKVRLVVGTSTSEPNPPYPAPGTEVELPATLSEIVTAHTKGRVQGAAGESFPVERLGITSLVYADGPAGLRIDPKRADEPNKTFYATAFPIATLLAASWDEAIVEQVGKAMGEEIREYGVDVLLAPGMNIQRNPLCGRAFEYYSEDPLLTGKTAAAMVRGVQSEGVGTSIKHFAANNQETYRNGIDVIVSERALREIYLRGFEIAVRESKPWTVMSSYNKINGTYTSESEWLLRTVLRDEWGFDGFVMTDWWGAGEPSKMMSAGCNLLMPGTPYQIATIKEAVESVKLPEEVLDQNVRDILNVTLRTPAHAKYNYSNTPDLASHDALTRKVATEGMVLLKNDNHTLPFGDEIGSIATFGNATYNTQAGGSGSGYVHRSHTKTIYNALCEAGYKTDSKLAERYTRYIAEQKSKLPAENFWYIPFVTEMEVATRDIRRAADESDLALITLGRMSGEGDDRHPGKGDYLLTEVEQSLVERVCEEFHKRGKRVVVVTNTGGVIDLSSWHSLPDAILIGWLAGQQVGGSVVDILSGVVCPSGRLPMTFAASYEQLPTDDNFGVSAGERSAVRYQEELMVGYRHFVTNTDQKPLYPFGYGLSYTTFDYSDLTIDKTSRKGNLTLSLTVTNSGLVAGREVVQIYVSKPDADSSRPARELCAYAKTDLLAAGESQRVTIEITADNLAQFDHEGSCMKVAAGDYTLYAAKDALSPILSLSHSVKKDIVTQRTHHQ